MGILLSETTLASGRRVSFHLQYKHIVKRTDVQAGGGRQSALQYGDIVKPTKALIRVNRYLQYSHIVNLPKGSSSNFAGWCCDTRKDLSWVSNCLKTLTRQMTPEGSADLMGQ